jgi:hypothetical protein
MSKPHARRARAEFDAMIEERNAAKRARRTGVVPHGPVAVTVPRSPAARLPTLAECHLGADKLIAADSVYAETCARLDAELAEILATGSGLEKGVCSIHTPAPTRIFEND